MKTLRLAKLYLLFMLCWGSAFGQGDFFKGIVQDASTKSPIAFATIRIQGKAIGVISNEDGSFKIPISFKEMGDVLEFSSMGYQKNQIPLSAFRIDDTNVVELITAPLELKETTVTAKIKKLTARRLVTFAINNIYNNYPTDAYAYLGYYRDYQRKNNTYVNLNEALISIVDQGFKTKDFLLTQYAIHEYKANLDFEVDSIARRPYDYETLNKVVPGGRVNNPGGNELMLLRAHDPIRNPEVVTFSFVNSLKDDFVDDHEFTLLGTTFYDNKPAHRIKISKDAGNLLVDGMIYIDKVSFAIRKLEYAVRKVTGEQRGAPAEYKGGFGTVNTQIVGKDLMLKIIIEYQEVLGKMRLNYISFVNKFRITRPPLFKIENIDIVRQDSSLVFYLNKPLITVRNLKKSNIKIEYDRQRIPIRNLIPISKNSFTLTLNDKKTKNRILIKQLFSQQIDPKKTKLKITPRNIKDSAGNVLQKSIDEELYQFREFFTQSSMPLHIYEAHGNKFMRKDKPLFSKEQPKFELPENQAFWMNTPLKKIAQ